jgi:cytochrome c-type biogenesis protein CcmH
MVTRWHRLATALIVAMLVCSSAFAVEPDEILSDLALEARARSISGGLRCLVCQNQSIDDSNAPLARDLRLLVRDRLKAGDSDEDVRAYIVSRYGEFVLLRPPLNIRTVLLWLAPLLVLLAAITIAVRVFVRRLPSSGRTGAPALTGAEEEKLRALLADADKSSKKS